MSDETIRHLKEEKTRLAQEQLKVDVELARLEPQDSKPAQASYGGLEKQSWEVLKFFFDHPHPMSVRMLSAELGGEYSVTHHHVDILLAVNFIHVQGRDYTMLRISNQVEPMFIIGSLGRDFYVAHRGT